MIGYGDQKTWGTWGFLEVDMSGLFSFAFAGIFLIFIFAAIIGHVLLVEALVRPFFTSGLAGANSTAMVSSSLLPLPTR
jgi:hypothetical protein